MKFLYYTSLIASVLAIRMQAHSQTKATIHAQAQDRHKDMAQWFIDEIHSVDGLTWEEFKYHMGAIATEHNYSPTEGDWGSIKAIFDDVVGLQFNPTIHPVDFERACRDSH